MNHNDMKRNVHKQFKAVVNISGEEFHKESQPVDQAENRTLHFPHRKQHASHLTAIFDLYHILLGVFFHTYSLKYHLR